MYDRADAHIHLFEGGYRGSFAGRAGVNLDEAALYTSLVEEHRVRRALVVGYAGDSWCVQNNPWIANAARSLPWASPLAYFDGTDPPSVETLEQLRNDGFVGLTIYLFDQASVVALGRIPWEFWSWLVERRWLVSVNSRGDFWSAWKPILERFEDLRILVSHLGLPERGDDVVASSAPASVLDLAAFSGPRVKLSGFYALTKPSSDYPHRSVWPYVEALIERFGTERLLWGSDFTPALDSVSFPQTYGLFSLMPFLAEPERRRIEGDNLLSLLGEI